MPRAEWMICGEDPWDELKCDHAQITLLTWLIDRIETFKEPVTLSALKAMRDKLKGSNEL
jgi:hypothetical protein